MTILNLENDSLRFALNADGSAHIEDKGSGASWRMAAIAWQEEGPIDVGHVWQRTGRSSCEQFAGRFRLRVEDEAQGLVHCTLLDELHQSLGDFRVRIHLDGPWLRFQLREIDERLPSLVFPPPLEASSLVLPQGVGKWIRKPPPARYIHRLYSGLNMRWFGGLQADEDKGYLAVWTQGHQNSALLTSGFHAMSAWLKSLGKWELPVTVSYRFTTGGYVGLARAYRAWAIEHGLHKPLTQKIEELPAVTTLLGGRELNCYLGHTLAASRFADQLRPVPPELGDREKMLQVHITYADVARVVDEARRIGWNRGVVMVRGWIRGGYDESHPDVWPPEEGFGSIDELKNLMRPGENSVGGLHDNYQDIYQGSPSFPHGVNITAEGKPMRGGYWEGGQSYILNSRNGLEYARRNWEHIQTLGAGKIYSDTITTQYLYESYEEGNTLSRVQDEAYKQQLMAFWKSQGLILASEEGSDFGIPYLDTADTQHAREVTDHSVTIPLWTLVFHDAVFSGRHNTTVPDRSGAAHIPWYLPNLLWGYYTMWAVPGEEEGRDGWKKGFAESLFVEDWHARIGLADMQSHRFLSEDFAVEETQFSDGSAIIVNFAPEPRQVEGITLAPGGHHFR
jgi:hypothetical protein